MELYAITAGAQPREGFPARAQRLERLARDWAAGGVDWIQIREKDLSPAEQTTLVSRLVATARGTQCQVLLNGPPTLAAEAGAGGVHLPGGWTAESVEAARQLWPGFAVISVSCHSVAEVAEARRAGATMALFAPVFSKVGAGRWGRPQLLPGVGIARLSEACLAAGRMPVFALGGVTAQNAAACMEAGAAGVAGIRLFLDTHGAAAAGLGGWKTLLR